MKTFTLSLITLCLSCTINSFAQSDSTKTEKIFRPLEDRKNELKIGAVKLIAGPVLDIEYERILNPYSSIGGNVVADLGDNSYIYDFSATPYFRMYFTQSREYGTKGLFAQAFMGYYTGMSSVDNYDAATGMYSYDEERWNSVGAGISAGGKWINRQGFVFQIVLGIGRNFTDANYVDQVIFQGDAYLGYRF